MTAYKFFLAHAGVSYNPATETEEQGRRRCARELAKAEAHARKVGWCYRWIPCDTTSKEFTDERPFYPLWRCVMTTRSGDYITSLCGVDFGRGKGPDGADYARVVEAELALEESK